MASNAGLTVTVTGKRWSEAKGDYVARYRCDRCGKSFVRDFHDHYPTKCPRCCRMLYGVNGEIGTGIRGRS